MIEKKKGSGRTTKCRLAMRMLAGEARTERHGCGLLRNRNRAREAAVQQS
jgi:hypothetical protein